MFQIMVLGNCPRFDSSVLNQVLIVGNGAFCSLAVV